jgi:hypothetical protein
MKSKWGLNSSKEGWNIPSVNKHNYPFTYKFYIFQASVFSLSLLASWIPVLQPWVYALAACMWGGGGKETWARLNEATVFTLVAAKKQKYSTS